MIHDTAQVAQRSLPKIRSLRLVRHPRQVAFHSVGSPAISAIPVHPSPTSTLQSSTSKGADLARDRSCSKASAADQAPPSQYQTLSASSSPTIRRVEVAAVVILSLLAAILDTFEATGVSSRTGGNGGHPCRDEATSCVITTTMARRMRRTESITRLIPFEDSIA